MKMRHIQKADIFGEETYKEKKYTQKSNTYIWNRDLYEEETYGKG